MLIMATPYSGIIPTANFDCHLGSSNASWETLNKATSNFDEQSLKSYEDVSFQEKLNAVAAEMERRSTTSYGLGYGLGKYVLGTIDESGKYLNPPSEMSLFQNIKNWTSQQWSYIANVAWEELTNRYCDIYLFFKGIDVDAAIVDQNEDVLTNPTYSDATKHAIHKKLKLAQEIQDQINEQYDVLNQKIKDAFEKANQNEKPLMILIGENHRSLHSAQIEALVIHIGKKLFGLNTILMEAFHKKDYSDHRQETALPLAAVENLSVDLEVKKIPIDLAMCAFSGQENFEGCESSNPLKPEIDIEKHTKMQYRNQVMANVAIKSNVNNTITIVGANHLMGLIEETSLSAHYEVLAINAADPVNFPSKKATLYAFTASKAVQASIPFLYQASIPFLYGEKRRENDFLIKQLKQRAAKAQERAKFR